MLGNVIFQELKFVMVLMKIGESSRIVGELCKAMLADSCRQLYLLTILTFNIVHIATSETS